MVETQTAYRFLKLENDGAVARVILARPPLNILDTAMIEELRRVFDDLLGEPNLRVLVLAAEGKAFSAGVSVEDHLPERVHSMLPAFHELFRKLVQLSCPVVSAVQGAALGGGCELACFADFVIASEAASFGQPEIRLGVFPPVAAVHFPQRIGLARTLQLVMTGEVLQAPEAERIGLVDKVVPAAGLAAAVASIVEHLRSKSAPALRLAKRACLVGRDFEADLATAERLFLDELMATHDAGEGLRAFLEKRAPVWAQR
jgi:cyclohexa-1,5-dienecarbonyl-CoA hydratase